MEAIDNDLNDHIKRTDDYAKFYITCDQTSDDESGERGDDAPGDSFGDVAFGVDIS